MKNSYRIPAFLIALIMIFSFLPAAAVYADSSLETVYLVQPEDVCYSGGFLYVADIIDDGENTVIHKISSDLASRESYYLDGVTEKIYVDGLNLYAMQNDKLLLLGIDSATDSLVLGSAVEIADIKDFVVIGKTVYILTDKDFKEYDADRKKLKTLYPNLTDTRSLSYVGGKIAIIYGENLLYYTDEDGYSDPTALTNGCDRIFGLGTAAFFYDGSQITDLGGTAILNLPNGILDATVYGNYLIVLGNDKKIIQYTYRDGVFTLMDGFVIGDDKIDKTVPTVFTGYTYACATGYPTNILYEASESSNPAPYQLLSENDSFIILHYDDMEDSEYYYVFYKGGFGWLEKASNDISSDRLHIYDTAYGFVGQAVTTAYVYSLPFYDDAGTYVIENVPKDTVFSISDRYENLTSSNAEWFYVSYETDGITKYGFVRQPLITDLQPDPQTEVTRYTVNTDLSNQLGLYRDSELSDPVCDEEGNPVMLNSGKQVSVISTDGQSAFVQVDVNGVKYLGYVDSSKLIKDGLTNYLALGLLLGIAVVLGAVFFAVLAKRRKKHAPPVTDEADPFEAEKL